LGLVLIFARIETRGISSKQGFGACTKAHDQPLNGGAVSIRKLGETFRGNRFSGFTLLGAKPPLI